MASCGRKTIPAPRSIERMPMRGMLQRASGIMAIQAQSSAFLVRMSETEAYSKRS